MSLFLFLELKGRQVQPLHPGTRMGQSAGGTKIFYKNVHENQRPHVLSLLLLKFVHLPCVCLRKCPTTV